MIISTASCSVISSGLKMDGGCDYQERMRRARESDLNQNGIKERQIE